MGKLNTAKQENVFGRTKTDSVEMEGKADTSHVGRTDLKENGKGLKNLTSELTLWYCERYARIILYCLLCNTL